MTGRQLGEVELREGNGTTGYLFHLCLRLLLLWINKALLLSDQESVIIIIIVMHLQIDDEIDVFPLASTWIYKGVQSFPYYGFIL